MQRYIDNVVNTAGAAVVGATVVITTLAGAAATLYAANGSGQMPNNVLTTDSAGGFTFYAPDGRYTITVSGQGITTKIFSDIILNDPRMSNNETPSGTINGSNKTFTLVNAPVAMAGSSALNIVGAVRQGGVGAFIPLVLGVDFTVSGNTVSMAIAPSVGANLVFTYGY